MDFNKENFTMQTMQITDDGEGWNSTLRSVFISDAQMAQQYRTLVGHIRIPIIKDGDNKPRCKLVNVKDPRCVVQRMVELNLFQNFLKARNLKGTDYKYVIITYTGKRESEWFAYANLLMKFVDYILPYIVKNISVITIDNLVFTEHAKPNTGSTTFHILFTADEATEFQQLWTMYIEYNEKKEKKLAEEEKNADKADSGNKEKSNPPTDDKKNIEENEIDSEKKETEKVGDVKIDKETGEVIETYNDSSQEQESIEEVPSEEELEAEEDFAQEMANESENPDFGDTDEEDGSENIETISFNEPDEEEYAETEEDG